MELSLHVRNLDLVRLSKKKEKEKVRENEYQCVIMKSELLCYKVCGSYS